MVWLITCHPRWITICRRADSFKAAFHAANTVVAVVVGAIPMSVVNEGI
jgi:hypothetical protein